MKQKLKSKLLQTYRQTNEYLNNIKFLLSLNYISFKRCKKKKFILLDTPIYGNLGDHAISVAELKFLKDNLHNPVFEFTHQEFKMKKNKIKKYINKDDVIVIQGGGFVGNLWPNEQEVFLDIISMFKNNKIVVFPQTIYFQDDENKTNDENLFLRTMDECTDLTFFVREEFSYNYLKQANVKNNFFLVPDIVTYLNYDFSLKRENVLFCLRKDKEKTVSDEVISIYRNKIINLGYTIDYTDTVLDKIVHKDEKVYYVEKKLKEFSKYKLIITDRLHGMLFATITGTPCIVFDNKSKKSSGTYKWIEYLNYVVINPQEDVIDEEINRLLCLENHCYDNQQLKTKYELILDCLKERGL